MKCGDCGTSFQGKYCPCGWSQTGTETKSTVAICSDCQETHALIHLKNAIPGKELCSTCFTIAQWNPADREYYRMLAKEHKVPMIDIPTHLLAANARNETLDEYLPTLPKTREQFRKYFKNKPITIGGITL